MKIGVPKEIKTHEYRVGLVPDSVVKLKALGHEIIVQSSAGVGIGVSDQAYFDAGARIAATADEVFAEAELLVKVKEPQAEEVKKLRTGQVVFTFLHLAANRQLAEALLQSGVVAIAYETVTDDLGRLPLLMPMSAVAGRIAVQSGAHQLEKPQGGRGLLLGGVPGVKPGKVVIIGGGTVGVNAAHIALGIGAEVVLLDISTDRIADLTKQFGADLQVMQATAQAIEDQLVDADLVIGAVLIPGAAAPKVVTKAAISKMQPGSVVVDVAIDQGGCIETSRPTSFSDPTYVESGVIHQCITNLPGAVPRTSTFALNNATLAFIIELANKGYVQACLTNSNLLAGLNICRGKVTHASVAKAIDHSYVPALDVLKKGDGYGD